MNKRLFSPPLTTRTHCRICEDPLKADDDPFWGLCAPCLGQKRDFWIHVYKPTDAEPAATGIIERPNRDA